jgi:hypothetical protein
MKTKSNLERILNGGHFAVTAEISPPRNAEFETIREKIGLIKGYVDAFNILMDRQQWWRWQAGQSVW